MSRSSRVAVEHIVVERDRGRCRFCGIGVDCDDKNGRGGGTYDHVDPDGGNQIGNVVVVCHGCRSGRVAGDARQRSESLVVFRHPWRLALTTAMFWAAFAAAVVAGLVL